MTDAASLYNLIQNMTPRRPDIASELTAIKNTISASRSASQNRAGNTGATPTSPRFTPTSGQGSGADTAAQWEKLARLLAKPVPDSSGAPTSQLYIGAYSRYFPSWFWKKYPRYVQYATYATPTFLPTAPSGAVMTPAAWMTPSTASLSLVYDSWPDALVEILDSEYMYRKDVRDMVSKAFREGHMLQTAMELGVPTRGRSKRAIIKDIASVFSSGRRSPRRRSPARRRSYRRSPARRRSYRSRY